MTSFNAASLKQLGWRQGSILPQGLVDALVREGLVSEQNKKSVLVVISQSCDLTNDSFDKEPNAEILIGNMVKRDPNLFYGKNSRALQLEREGDQALEFLISNRTIFPRCFLTSIEPGERLEKNEISLLAKWVARRYTRAAFPDEFNRRVQKIERKLHKKLKNLGEILLGIWIDVEDSDLSSKENYKIFVYVVVQHDAFSDPRKRAEASELANNIDGQLKGCEGVEVIGDVQLLSSTQFSIDLYMNTKRWDFDDISLRDEDIQLPT